MTFAQELAQSTFVQIVAAIIVGAAGFLLRWTIEEEGWFSAVIKRLLFVVVALGCWAGAVGIIVWEECVPPTVNGVCIVDMAVVVLLMYVGGRALSAAFRRREAE